MTKMSDLPAHLQLFIKSADFNHYYCWRVVYKEDSQSTPVRLVVDPTMSGLNILLAKGENNLGNIFDILVQSRTNQFSWAADISKLYNMLHLDTSALPFSLFLYHTSMDANIEPDIYVMTRAWYGVVPTGAQAAVAIKMLTELSSDAHPGAVEVLSKDIYVDDVNPGAETEAARDAQISSTQLVLKKGGFGFKYVVYSGKEPGEKASSDGVHIKILGYKWDSEQDILYPGFTKLNLNKKV